MLKKLCLYKTSQDGFTINYSFPISPKVTWDINLGHHWLVCLCISFVMLIDGPSSGQPSILREIQGVNEFAKSTVSSGSHRLKRRYCVSLSSNLPKTATTRAVQPAPNMPTLTDIARPQYVCGTISPYPTERNVMATSHSELGKLWCSTSWSISHTLYKYRKHGSTSLISAYVVII